MTKVYEAYSPSRTEHIQRKTFPREEWIGEGIFGGRYVTVQDTYYDDRHYPEKRMKIFDNELDCLKYCVKNGYRYRELEVENSNV